MMACVYPEFNPNLGSLPRTLSHATRISALCPELHRTQPGSRLFSVLFVPAGRILPHPHRHRTAPQLSNRCRVQTSAVLCCACRMMSIEYNAVTGHESSKPAPEGNLDQPEDLVAPAGGGSPTPLLPQLLLPCYTCPPPSLCLREGRNLKAGRQLPVAGRSVLIFRVVTISHHFSQVALIPMKLEVGQKES